MSMKIKGRLMDKGSSRIETAYAGKSNVIRLEDVPCELAFKASSAFVEHEDEKHHYLPCFKLRGIINEVKGDFPYHITSVYFADDDQADLTKTISYYPSPKELAHMIEVGGFYSRRFAVPEVISENIYSFPALVDLVIVPPPNPAAYELAAYDPMSDAMDLNSVNLPVVYVRLKGSGITRKTDPLLDYYDIDLDDDFQMFAMTAESSGYREPQLLEYIPEPEPEPELEQAVTDTVQRVDDVHYITPEEEAEMLNGHANSYQKEMEDTEPSFTPANPEDALLIKTSGEIAQRVRERHGEKTVSYETVFGNKGREHQNDLISSRMTELDNRKELSANKEKGKVLETTASKTIEQPAKTADTNHVKPSFAKDARKMTREPIAKPIPEEPEKKPRRSFSSIIMTEAAARAAERRSQMQNPDVPQKQADVKMDLNPERNEHVADKREDVKAETVADKDVHTLRDMNGADVSDAREQAKIDDQHSQDIAQDVARSVQASVVKQNEEKTKVVSGNKPEDKTDAKAEVNAGAKDKAKDESKTVSDEKPNEAVPASELTSGKKEPEVASKSSKRSGSRDLPDVPVDPDGLSEGSEDEFI